MCGRFVQSQSPSAYADYFGVSEVKTESLAPSYNVAPTDPVYAVAEHEGVRQLGTFRWGLLPFWAKDRKMAARNINARAESVAHKPTFRESTNRCDHFSSERWSAPLLLSVSIAANIST